MAFISKTFKAGDIIAGAGISGMVDDVAFDTVVSAGGASQAHSPIATSPKTPTLAKIEFIVPPSPVKKLPN